MGEILASESLSFPFHTRSLQSYLCSVCSTHLQLSGCAEHAACLILANGLHLLNDVIADQLHGGPT